MHTDSTKEEKCQWHHLIFIIHLIYLFSISAAVNGTVNLFRNEINVFAKRILTWRLHLRYWTKIGIEIQLLLLSIDWKVAWKFFPSNECVSTIANGLSFVCVCIHTCFQVFLLLLHNLIFTNHKHVVWWHIDSNIFEYLHRSIPATAAPAMPAMPHRQIEIQHKTNFCYYTRIWRELHLFRFYHHRVLSFSRIIYFHLLLFRHSFFVAFHFQWIDLWWFHDKVMRWGMFSVLLWM